MRSIRNDDRFRALHIRERADVIAFGWWGVHPWVSLLSLAIAVHIAAMVGVAAYLLAGWVGLNAAPFVGMCSGLYLAWAFTRIYQRRRLGARVVIRHPWIREYREPGEYR